MKKKLIVIGLDGGTFSIVDPLLRKGALPFIGALVEKGVKGVLKSTMPPVTAPAWTSFMTGKNPGSHGLFDFQKLDSRTGDRSLTSSTDCHSATLWDYLGESGKKMILVNIPMTYPPMHIKGVVISGFPVPHHSEYTYPQEIYSYIKSRGYVTDWLEISSNFRSLFLSKVRLMKKVERIRMDIFLDILKKHAWDVAMLVISGTDHVSHREWQKGNRKAVEDFYVYVDKLLLRLHEEHKDCHYMIISDHGFTSTKRIFYMNAWLRAEGYISYRMGLNETYDKFLGRLNENRKRKLLNKILSIFGLTKNNLKYFGKKTGLIRLERCLPYSIVKMFPSADIVPVWRKTRAYMASVASKGVNINCLGREKHGIVPESEYEGLRQEIIEKLRGLKDEDGKAIFSLVESRENVYKGPYIHLAPDIIVWPAKEYNIRMGTGVSHYIDDVIDARHDMEGLFIFSGNEVKKEVTVSASIEDIAPTVLHFLEVSCPDDMDGQIIKDCFEQASDSAARPIQLRVSLTKELPEKEFLVKEEKDEISKKLQALGYM